MTAELRSDETSARSVSARVIEAIAEHERLDPLDVDPPLAEVIDTDALDAIIGGAAPGLADITVQFSHNGCRVHVSSDGTIEVSSGPAGLDG
jgi:hypothetical protein